MSDIKTPYLNGHMYEFDLCWIVEQIKKAMTELQNLIDTTTKHDNEIAQLQSKYDHLAKQLADLESMIKNGDFPDTALKEWADKNVPGLIADIVKYVFFGLSTDGHFVAAIPTAWDFIQFDTVVDINSDFYGHLILRW